MSESQGSASRGSVDEDRLVGSLRFMHRVIGKTVCMLSCRERNELLV